MHGSLKISCAELVVAVYAVAMLPFICYPHTHTNHRPLNKADTLLLMNSVYRSGERVRRLYWSVNEIITSTVFFSSVRAGKSSSIVQNIV